jgi:hypothetical protein
MYGQRDLASGILAIAVVLAFSILSHFVKLFALFGVDTRGLARKRALFCQKRVDRCYYPC